MFSIQVMESENTMPPIAAPTPQSLYQDFEINYKDWSQSSFHCLSELREHRERTRYEIFETADLPLKLIPATLLCLIGAFLDFLSGRILKVCSMYSDFQKIERKK